MSIKQYRKLGCLDVSPTGGCAFEVRAESDDEVMRMVANHAAIMHKMTDVPPELAVKIRGAIQSVSVDV